MTETVDGHTPFDPAATCSDAGMDCSGSDHRVRTHDQVAYTVDTSVNTAAATNVTYTVTISGLTDNIAHPQVAFDAGSTCVNSATGTTAAFSTSATATTATLTCVLGNVPAGSTFSNNVFVNVLGTATDGESLSASVVETADAATTAQAPAAAVTVSAAPRWDLSKDQGNHYRTDQKGSAGIEEASVGGVPGYEVFFPILLRAERQLGSAELSSPLTFTDDLSQLYPQGGVTPTLLGCAPNGRTTTAPDGTTQVGFTVEDNPLGTPNPSAGTQSGTFTCAQSGDQVAVTIAGADTTENSPPDYSADTSRAPGFVAVSGWIAIFVPQTVAAAQHDPDTNVLLLHNTFTDFTPKSTAGQANFAGAGEPTANNSVTYELQFDPANTGAGANSFSVQKKYGTSLTDLDTPGVKYGNGSSKGIGTVSRGQTFSTSVSFSQKLYVSSNLVLCDLLDPRENQVTGRFAPNDGTYVVEYGTGAVPMTYAQQQGQSCADGSGGAGTADGWYASIADVPGGAAAITKVRALRQTPLPAKTTATVVFELTVPQSAPENPNVDNFGWVRTPDIYGGVPMTDPVADTNATGRLADRIAVTADVATVGLRILAPGDDPANPTQPAPTTFFAGDNVTWDLRPALSTTGADTTASTVTACMAIPYGEEYVPGSARQGSTVLTGTVSPDGSTQPGESSLQVCFTVPATPNQPITPITFQTHISISTPAAIYTAHASVSSPSDTSDSELHTVGPVYVTVQQVAGYRVDKTTSTPDVQVDQPFQYTLTESNQTSTALASTDVIDSLPNPGDGRTPGTSFTGTYKIVRVMPSDPAATVYYDASVPASDDPKDFPNPGSAGSPWCTSAQFGQAGCPATLAEARAFRVMDTNQLAVRDSRTIDVDLQPTGNKVGDTYTNSFTARAAGLALPCTPRTCRCGWWGHPGSRTRWRSRGRSPRRCRGTR